MRSLRSWQPPLLETLPRISVVFPGPIAATLGEARAFLSEVSTRVRNSPTRPPPSVDTGQDLVVVTLILFR